MILGVGLRGKLEILKKVEKRGCRVERGVIEWRKLTSKSLEKSDRCCRKWRKAKSVL